MDAQRLENHKRVLGIIYIISAAFLIIGMLILNAVMSMIFGFAFQEASEEEQRIVNFIMSIVSYLPTILILFLAVPSIIAGIGLLTRQSWAVLFALIIGCLKLFSFPLGTAIGIYAIWIYSEDQKLTRAAASN